MPKPSLKAFVKDFMVHHWGTDKKNSHKALYRVVRSMEFQTQPPGFGILDQLNAS